MEITLMKHRLRPSSEIVEILKNSCDEIDELALEFVCV